MVVGEGVPPAEWMLGVVVLGRAAAVREVGVVLVFVPVTKVEEDADDAAFAASSASASFSKSPASDFFATVSLDCFNLSTAVLSHFADLEKSSETS